MSRRGLGRGLGALIPSGTATETVTLTPSEQHASPRPTADASPTDAFFRSSAASGSDPTPDRRPETDVDSWGRAERPAEAAGPGQDVTLAPVGATFAEIPLGQIRPNPRQPRQVFDMDDLAELVSSIQTVGLLQPVVVRPVPHEAADRQHRDLHPDERPGRSYELVVGERRLRAARQAGLSAIPAIVRETDDEDLLRNALLENLHRSQLNPLEEAAAYDQLLKDFGCTQDELAARIGRSRPQISNTLRLLNLPATVQRRVAAGVLSAGHARALLGLADAQAQDRLAHRIVAEGLSVRAVEEIVAVGDDGARATRTRRPRGSTPGLEDVAARLSGRLETRVKVDANARGSTGKVTIEFGSLDDLQRIVALIDPSSASQQPA